MNAVGAVAFETGGHLARRIGIYGGLVPFPVEEADALPFQEIDGGEEDHGFFFSAESVKLTRLRSSAEASRVSV